MRNATHHALPFRSPLPGSGDGLSWWRMARSLNRQRCADGKRHNHLRVHKPPPPLGHLPLIALRRSLGVPTSHMVDAIATERLCFGPECLQVHSTHLSLSQWEPPTQSNPEYNQELEPMMISQKWGRLTDRVATIQSSTS